MHRRRIVGPKALAAWATLLGATVLTAAPSAHGSPIGPECAGQFEVPSDFYMLQDNHLKVTVNTDADSRAIGPATYEPTNGDALPVFGNARGGLNPDGRTFTYTVDWLNGFTNTYYGTFSNEGSISGYTVNNRGTRNNWTTDSGAQCKPAPTPMAPVSVPGLH